MSTLNESTTTSSQYNGFSLSFAVSVLLVLGRVLIVQLGHAADCCHWLLLWPIGGVDGAASIHACRACTSWSFSFRFWRASWLCLTFCISLWVLVGGGSGLWSPREWVRHRSGFCRCSVHVDYFISPKAVRFMLKTGLLGQSGAIAAIYRIVDRALVVMIVECRHWKRCSLFLYTSRGWRACTTNKLRPLCVEYHPKATYSPVGISHMDCTTTTLRSVRTTFGHGHGGCWPKHRRWWVGKGWIVRKSSTLNHYHGNTILAPSLQRNRSLTGSRSSDGEPMATQATLVLRHCWCNLFIW